MKILIIGGNGTLGKKICERLKDHHMILTAGRSSGDFKVDITSEESIKQLFKQVPDLDACICVAASGAMDNFQTLTAKELQDNMNGKLLGQVNLVLIGQHYLNTGGVFTLTSGIFADEPSKGVTGGGLISGALHSFVLSAAIELNDKKRINCVSPGMAEDTAAKYGQFFPHLKPISMERLVNAYVNSVEEVQTGKIFRVY